MTDAGVGKKVAERCRSLQVPPMPGGAQATDAVVIGRVAERRLSLQELKVSCCRLLTDAGVGKVAEGC